MCSLQEATGSGLFTRQTSKMATSVSEKVNNEELRRWLEGLNDEDLGRYKM